MARKYLLSTMKQFGGEVGSYDYFLVIEFLLYFGRLVEGAVLINKLKDLGLSVCESVKYQNQNMITKSLKAQTLLKTQLPVTLETKCV